MMHGQFDWFQFMLLEICFKSFILIHVAGDHVAGGMLQILHLI
jgi:hypothetical protein